MDAFSGQGLDMGTLALETEDVSSDIYLSLGLKELDKGVGAPRVLSLLSSLLERSVQRNETLLEAKHIKDDVTVFHGLRAPTLSVRKYIDRIFKYSGCSPSCFVVAHIYVDRFLQSTEMTLTSLNVHRLLITSIMLAAKFMDDAFFNNAYYAKVGGVSTCEINRLEMSFLFGIDFRLQVSVDTFGSYCWQLEKEASEALQIERPMQACRIKESWSNKDDPTCASTIAR
ncbi:Cyclin-like [Sesbania bispinosa]|nr:Cyclin-like [Sesbania bispinosa]